MAPPSGSNPRALLRAPSVIMPAPEGAKPLSYPRLVQPVLDKHCVSCHDYGKPAGKKLNLSGGQTMAFNVSYMELWRKRYVGAVGAGPSHVLPPYAWGSHASRFVKGFTGDKHPKVQLDTESYDRLVTWIDINGPYYPEYASAYRNNAYGRSPLTNAEINMLRRLTGARQNRRVPYVDLGRPSKSPCLSKFTNHKDPKYVQALGIIRVAAARLAKRPRADMPGFKYLDEEARRQKVYEQFFKVEADSRKAIVEDRRVYPFKPSE